MKYISLLLLLVSQLCFATLNDVDRAEFKSKNILENPGFENGKGKWSITGGSWAIATSGSELLTGKTSMTWDSNGAGQLLNSNWTVLPVPQGLYGKNGVAFCKIRTPSGTATHQLIVGDSINVYARENISSSVLGEYTVATFTFPESTAQIGIGIISVASNEPSITVDDCFVGENTGIFKIDSGAQFAGESYIPGAASCVWTRTNTAIGAHSTDTDCNGTSTIVTQNIGTWSTSNGQLPQQTITNLPAGVYVVFASFKVDSSAGNGTHALSDGTTTSGSGGNNITSQIGAHVMGVFTYQTSGSRTFALHCGNTSGNCQVENDVTTTGAGTRFQIFRYPLGSSLATNFDTSTMMWSGYHDNTCSWARTNTAYGDPTADSTCALVERKNVNFGTVATYTVTNPEPGIVFTPKRNGVYFVCAGISTIGSGNTAAAHSVALLDDSTIISEQGFERGTSAQGNMTLCGLVTATTTSSKTVKLQTKAASSSITLNSGAATASAIEWNIVYISQNFPTPHIVNSVKSTYSAQTRIEAAKLNCDSGAAILSQHGTWVTSIGNVASGACAVTLTSGIFTATPYCTATAATTGGFSTGLELNVDATSTTAVSVDCEDDASNACTAFDFILQCVGPG